MGWTRCAQYHTCRNASERVFYYALGFGFLGMGCPCYAGVATPASRFRTLSPPRGRQNRRARLSPPGKTARLGGGQTSVCLIPPHEGRGGRANIAVAPPHRPRPSPTILTPPPTSSSEAGPRSPATVVPYLKSSRSPSSPLPPPTRHPPLFGARACPGGQVRREAAHIKPPWR